MRVAVTLLVGCALAATIAAAQPRPPTDVTRPPALAVLEHPPDGPAEAASEPADADGEIARLRQALSEEVPHLALDVSAREADWIRLATAALAAGGQAIDRPQLLVVVDRSPKVQELCIVAARPDAPWQVIGGIKVSTGKPGRFEHFVTPLGVFLHTDALLDYRAEGTFNENHIRGLGSKGMRVWDFGWQQATESWRSDGKQGKLRLLIHATDPDRLEQRLGRSASEGCVRISAAMNRFLDRHGVLDADYERAAMHDPRFRALLAADRVPTPLAGHALVVVDSSTSSN